MQIFDDGIGFDQTQIVLKDGLGINQIEYAGENIFIYIERLRGYYIIEINKMGELIIVHLFWVGLV